MPYYKCTLGFARANTGWSENYYATVNVPTALLSSLQALINSRFLMLDPKVSCIGLRIANLGNTTPIRGTRMSQLLLPGNPEWKEAQQRLILPAFGSFTSAIVNSQPAEMRAVMQLQATLSNGRNKIRYLSDIPNVVIGGEPSTYISTGDPLWAKQLSLYLGQFTGFWGVLGQATGGQQFQILGFSYDSSTPPNLIVIVSTNSTPPPSFTPLQRIQVGGVRGPKGTHGTPTVNGQWHVLNYTVGAPGSPGMITLAGSGGISAAGLRLTDKSYVKYTNLSYLTITQLLPLRVGIHKRGRPFASPVGRRLTRLSLDP